MNKKKIVKITAAVTIFIIAVAFIQLQKKVYIDIIQKSPKVKITKLHKFKTLDVAGNPVESSSFEGKNLYVQFVDPLDFDDLDLIKTVYFNAVPISRDFTFVSLGIFILLLNKKECGESFNEKYPKS